MKIDLEQKLGEILSSVPTYKDSLNINNKLFVLLRKLFQSIPESHNIAVIGAGESASKLLNHARVDRKIQCFVEVNVNKNTASRKHRQIQNVDMISLDQLPNYDIQTVIIVTNRYMKEVFNQVYGNSEYNVIDMYDYICSHNHTISLDFLNFESIYNTQYEEIMLLQKKYKYEKVLKQKEWYLERLIYKYLLLFDFQTAFQFISEYIQSDYRFQEQFITMEHQLKLFLASVKSEIKKRSQNDIVIFWMDALRTDEVSKMDYLFQISRESKVFDNAFTTVYDTCGTMKSIVNKELQIDDFTEEDIRINNENSILLSKLEENNYNFHVICGGESEFYIFDKTLTTLNDYYSPCSIKLWELVKLLLESDKPMCILTHLLTETHPPFHCPNIEQDFYYDRSSLASDYEKQIDTSLSYLDKQLRFYLDLLGQNCKKVFLSDHAKPRSLKDLCTLQPTYWDELLHVVMFIHMPGIKPEHENRLYSHINFLEVIEYIMNPTDENYQKIFSEEYIKIQSVDRYSGVDIQKKLADGTDIENLMAYRGVRTSEDKYILLSNGSERYYRLPDENKNLIDDLSYEDRIRYLKKQTGTYFLDLSKFSLFKDSLKYIYHLENLHCQEK